MLDKRLTATEEKILKIKAGTVSVSTAPRVQSASACAAGAASDVEGSAAGEVPALSEARAFPVDKAAVSANRQKNGSESDQRDPDSISADDCSVGIKASDRSAKSEPMFSGRVADSLQSGPKDTARPDDPDPDETAEVILSVQHHSGPVGGEPKMRDGFYPGNGFTAGLIPNLSDWVIRRFVEKHYPPFWLEKLTEDREQTASPP